MSRARASLAFVIGVWLTYGLYPWAARAQSTRMPAATSGKTLALVVFVRFADDRQHGGACRGDKGWPLSQDGVEDLPAYAHVLFSPTDEPPFSDSTVTQYFFQQSNGKLILYADVYPDVIVSDHEMAYYRSSQGRGYGYLSEEIMAKMDAGGVDFARYDNNPEDGIVDQVFIILRRDDAGTFTGVADLSGADQVRGRPNRELRFDGVKLDWASSGSFIYHERPGHVLTQEYMTRLIAHEYGHHLWNPRGFFPGHVPAITSNQVPKNNTRHIGFTLMAGRGGGRDSRGDLLISAPERELLGWLEPRVLNPSFDTVQVVTVGDLYSTGGAVRIDVPGLSADRQVSFYVTNRQRIGWFDQYRVDNPGGDCTIYEMGLLRTTGLHVKITDVRRGRFSLDVLPADNTLELSAENGPYEGDLFGPRTSTQLTPFTEPSTSLPDGKPTWIALDEINLAGTPDSAMMFTFVPDFRDRAIIRTDSRVTEGHGEVVLRAGLRLKNGSTLTVGAGGRLNVRGEIELDPGSTILAEAGAQVTIDRVRRFYFEDTVVGQG